MHLYIIRHAEPAYPEDALTPHGHDQARALARRLSELRPQALYSSPMGRARETAQHAFQHLDLPLQIEPWTQELESWVIAAQRREHQPWGEAPAWEIDPRAVRGKPWNGPWHAEPPWQEAGLAAAFEALAQHSDQFLERHGLVREGAIYRLKEGVEGAPQSIALICHCGFALTWLAHLLALPPPVLWAGFTLAPASLTTVAFEPLEEGKMSTRQDVSRRAVPRCLGLGEVSHLEK